MSRHPPRNSTRSGGSSRGTSGSNHTSSYSTSSQSNNTSQTHGNVNQDSATSYQRTTENPQYSQHRPSDYELHRHQQPQYSYQTHRSWDRTNPEVYEVIENPALNPRYSSSQGHSSTGQYAYQSHQQYHLSRPQYSSHTSGAYQSSTPLNASSLQTHGSHYQQTTRLSEWANSNQRAGPYDAVDYENSDYGNEEYNYRTTR